MTGDMIVHAGPGEVTAVAQTPHGRARVEALLAAVVLIAIALAAWHFVRDGYLPQPFYYKPDQSLMDGYNTAYWANHAGAYDVWRSLYPPLSFVLLKLFSTHACYRSDALSGRACDPAPAIMLAAFFVLNAVLVYRTYGRADPRTAAARTVAMALGLPMLYALERGNLLIVCFTALVLGYGNLLRTRWLRAVSMAAAINLKPYLLFSLVPFIQRRAWSWLLVCTLAALAIYLASYLIFQSGTPLQIWTNDARYGVAARQDHFEALYYATSYWPLIRALQTGALGAAAPGDARIWALALTLVLRVTQAAACAVLVAGFFRPGQVNVRRFGALAAAVSLTAVTTGSSGYALIFLLFPVFFEPWRGPIRGMILVLAYLMCVPVDWMLASVVHGPTLSFLSGRPVVADFGISLGQLLRPAMLLVMLVGLIILNAEDVFAGLVRREWIAPSRRTPCAESSPSSPKAQEAAAAHGSMPPQTASRPAPPA